MKKVYYEKIGRKYVPVSEYDSDWMDSFGRGNHLVMCYPGGKSTQYNVDPNLAALIAASRVAQEPMREAIYEAAVMQRQKREGEALTDEQLLAWHKFVEVMGDRGRYIQFNSAHDIAQAGIRALEQTAAELMTNPAVQDAYQQFLLVCKLAEEKS